MKHRLERAPTAASTWAEGVGPKPRAIANRCTSTLGMTLARVVIAAICALAVAVAVALAVAVAVALAVAVAVAVALALAGGTLCTAARWRCMMTEVLPGASPSARADGLCCCHISCRICSDNELLPDSRAGATCCASARPLDGLDPTLWEGLTVLKAFDADGGRRFDVRLLCLVGDKIGTMVMDAVSVTKEVILLSQYPAETVLAGR